MTKPRLIADSANVNSIDGSRLSNSSTPFVQLGSTVERTAALKLQEQISVKDFGAKGDGVTDDTAAIQAALDVGSGRQIFFPAGQYIVSSSLQVRTRTEIVGEQKGQLGFPPGYQNYFGDYVSGTLIKYTGSGACFDVIGTPEERIEQCIFSNLALWGAPLQVTTNFGLYKPKFFDSVGFACHYGGGHTWVNCWMTSFGYAGIRLGIQGTYKNISYEGHTSGSGRPTNCKIIDCYMSNIFGYALVAYTEQLEVIGWQSDSFTINTSAYSGFQNPVSGDYETGAVFLANSVHCRFTSCHFEGDSGRSSGVNILRHVVDSSSNLPNYNRFDNCLFYGNIYGLQIGRIGGLSPVLTTVSCSTFDSAANNPTGILPIAGLFAGGLQSNVTGCSFKGSQAQQAVIAAGTDGVLSNNVFLQCKLPIRSTYRDLLIGNTSTGTIGSHSVVQESEFGRLVSNVFDKSIDIGDTAIKASSIVDDRRLGIKTTSSLSALSLSHAGTVTATVLGAPVARLTIGSDISGRPWTLRVKSLLQHSSNSMGEALIAGVSTSGSSPTITLQSLIASVSYTAVSDFITLTTGTGFVEIRLKSGVGTNALALFEIEVAADNAAFYLPLKTD